MNYSNSPGDGFMGNCNLPKPEDFIKTIPSRYTYLETLGRGGMGIVYKVRDEKIQRNVALKIILTVDCEVQRQRFEREVMSMANLRHRNILEIYDYGKDPFYYTMPIVEESLLKKIELSLELEECVFIAVEIASGLEFLHSKGFVHRDLKLENVLFDNGVAKISDFGLVLDPNKEKLTKEGAICGTLEYMSPEQLGGEKIDLRSDLYSFGVLLQKMLCNVNSMEQNKSLISICDKLLERDREKRYQNASIVIDELKRCNGCCIANDLTEIITNEQTTEQKIVRQTTPQFTVEEYIMQREKEHWEKQHQEAVEEYKNAIDRKARRTAERKMRKAKREL